MGNFLRQNLLHRVWRCPLRADIRTFFRNLLRSVHFWPAGPHVAECKILYLLVLCNRSEIWSLLILLVLSGFILSRKRIKLVPLQSRRFNRKIQFATGYVGIGEWSFPSRHIQIRRHHGAPNYRIIWKHLTICFRRLNIHELDPRPALTVLKCRFSPRQRFQAAGARHLFLSQLILWLVCTG